MANNNRQIIVPRYPSKVGAEYTKINVIDNNDGTVSLYVQDDGNVYATNPLAITATGDGVKGVGGGGGTVAGTIGKIPKFTAANAVGDSLMTQVGADMIVFGPADAAHPAFKLSGNPDVALQLRLGDDSAYAPLETAAIRAENATNEVSRIKATYTGMAALELWGSDTGILTLHDLTGVMVGSVGRDVNGALFLNSVGDLTLDPNDHLVSNKEIEVINSSTQLSKIKSTNSGNGALDLWAEGDNLTFHNQAGSVLVGRIGRSGGSLSVRSDYGDLQLNASNNILCLRPLAVSNSAAAVGAVGALANKLEVFDAAGASLGFIPIYASIS